jgi:hypothetical protein
MNPAALFVFKLVVDGVEVCDYDAIIVFAENVGRDSLAPGF